MKKDQNEDKKGFSYWFNNVFLYHYGKWALVAIIAIAVIIFISVESGGKKPKYDFQMGLIVSGGIAYDSTEELRNLVSEAVGDVNGDGNVIIDLQIVNLGDPEYLEANYNKVMLLMSQSEYPLFILDDEMSALYCSKDYFDDYTRFGITPDDRFNSRVCVTDSQVMKSIGADYEYYACIVDWTTVGKGKQARTDAAVRVVKALIAD